MVPFALSADIYVEEGVTIKLALLDHGCNRVEVRCTYSTQKRCVSVFICIYIYVYRCVCMYVFTCI